MSPWDRMATIDGEHPRSGFVIVTDFCETYYPHQIASRAAYTGDGQTIRDDDGSREVEAIIRADIDAMNVAWSGGDETWAAWFANSTRPPEIVSEETEDTSIALIADGVEHRCIVKRADLGLDHDWSYGIKRAAERLGEALGKNVVAQWRKTGAAICGFVPKGDAMIWQLTHADGRTAVVRADSGPLAMQMLGWRAASFDTVSADGDAEILCRAPAPVPQHDPQKHIEVLNEGFDVEDEPVMRRPVEWDPQP